MHFFEGFPYLLSITISAPFLQLVPKFWTFLRSTYWHTSNWSNRFFLIVFVFFLFSLFFLFWTLLFFLFDFFISFNLIFIFAEFLVIFLFNLIFLMSWSFFFYYKWHSEKQNKYTKIIYTRPYSSEESFKYFAD